MARPRSMEARRDVLAAAAAVMAEHGVDHLTIDEVAARSGVAKTTIYRHWPSRRALVIDGVRSTWAHLVPPDTGTLRGDLLDLFAHLTDEDLAGQTGQMLPSLLSAAARDPELDCLARQLFEERNRPVVEVLGRARARGEIGEVEEEVALATVIGPLLFQKVHRRRPITRPFLEACADAALAGLLAAGRRPPPAS